MNEHELLLKMLEQLHSTNKSLLEAINQTNKHVADINTTMREHFGIHTTQIKRHDEDIQEIRDDIQALDIKIEATEKALDRIQVKGKMIIKFIYFLWAVTGGLLTYFSSSIKSFFMK